MVNPNSYIFISSFKSYLTYNESVRWINNNTPSLIDLARQVPQNQLVIMPSFDALSFASSQLKNSPVKIGAQNCSPFDCGPYTGEVPARSLADLGCSYCFVGHSERRVYFHETAEQIIAKIKLLHASEITPILCIGESKEEYEKKKSPEIISEQLSSIVQEYKAQKKLLYIAYEPQWAIGTGIVPEIDYLDSIYAHIAKVAQDLPFYKLVYGGSVDEKSVIELKKVTALQGFLIGKASLDFQTFKNIVLS